MASVMNNSEIILEIAVNKNAVKNSCKLLDGFGFLPLYYCMFLIYEHKCLGCIVSCLTTLDIRYLFF